MKWESNGALDYRLVADDGEILERVEHRSGEYQVASTGKRYVSSEQAKKAAERRHSTPGVKASDHQTPEQGDAHE